MEQIKLRNDIELIEVTRRNRDDLPEQIQERIKTELGNRKVLLVGNDRLGHSMATLRW